MKLNRRQFLGIGAALAASGCLGKEETHDESLAQRIKGSNPAWDKWMDKRQKYSDAVRELIDHLYTIARRDGDDFVYADFSYEFGGKRYHVNAELPTKEGSGLRQGHNEKHSRISISIQPVRPEYSDGTNLATTEWVAFLFPAGYAIDCDKTQNMWVTQPQVRADERFNELVKESLEWFMLRDVEVSCPGQSYMPGLEKNNNVAKPYTPTVPSFEAQYGARKCEQK